MHQTLGCVLGPARLRTGRPLLLYVLLAMKRLGGCYIQWWMPNERRS